MLFLSKRVEILLLSPSVVVGVADAVLSPGMVAPCHHWSRGWTASAGRWPRLGWTRLPVPIAAGSAHSDRGLALRGQQPHRTGCRTGDLILVGSEEQRASHREDVRGAI